MGAVGRPVHFPTYNGSSGVCAMAQWVARYTSPLTTGVWRNGAVGRPVHSPLTTGVRASAQWRSGSPGTLPHLQREFGWLGNGAVGRPVHFPTYNGSLGGCAMAQWVARYTSPLTNGSLGGCAMAQWVARYTSPPYIWSLGRLRNREVGRAVHFPTYSLPTK